MTTTTTASPHADHAAAADALREMPGVYLPVETYPTSDAAAVMALSVRGGDGHYAPAEAYDSRIRDVDGGTRLYVAYVAPLRQQNEISGLRA